MGFLDKVFGGKAGGGASSESRGDFRVHDFPEKGFTISMPPEWAVVESPSGIEAHPQNSVRVSGPGSGGDIASPGVGISISEIPDPRQNAVKEAIRARSTAMAGHRMVKHIAGDVKNADFGIVYEYQYGPGESPIRAVGAIAQKKNKLFTVSAHATAQDFDKNRKTLEAVVASFKLL